MLVRDVMDAKAARVPLGTSMAHAAEVLVLTRASDLAVVDEHGALVGVLAEGDLLHAVVPDFEGLAETAATLDDACRAFAEAGDHHADQPIDRLVIRGSITVAPGDELLKAATVMLTKGIRRLAVVEADGRFAGTVSRADVCWGVLVAAPARGRAGGAVA